MGKSKGEPLIHKVAFLGGFLLLIGAFLPHRPDTWSYVTAAFDGWKWGGFLLILPIIALIVVAMEFAKSNKPALRFIFGLGIIAAFITLHSNNFENFKEFPRMIKDINFGMLSTIAGAVILFISAFIPQPVKE